jgi:hypothetical protein
MVTAAWMEASAIWVLAYRGNGPGRQIDLEEARRPLSKGEPADEGSAGHIFPIGLAGVDAQDNRPSHGHALW